MILKVDVDHMAATVDDLRAGRHGDPRLARSRLAVEGVDAGHVEQALSIGPLQQLGLRRLIVAAQDGRQVDGFPAGLHDLAVLVDHDCLLGDRDGVQDGIDIAIILLVEGPRRR